jgi:hypothetical protein
MQERKLGNDSAADRFEEQARQSSEFGRLILRYVLDGGPGNAGPGEDQRDRLGTARPGK